MDSSSAVPTDGPRSYVGKGLDGKKKDRWHAIRGTREVAERTLTEIVRTYQSGIAVEPPKPPEREAPVLDETKGVSFHTLRHACASVLLKHRVPLPAVSARLGHAKISTTANIYAHVLPGEDEAVSAAIDAPLRAAGVQIPALPAGEGK